MTTLIDLKDIPQTAPAQSDRTPPARRRGGGRIEYRAYLAATYPLFFVAACLARVFTPARRRPRKGSVFADALEMGQSTIPWVFMAPG
ncbi:MAG: hypothetical protein AAGC56_02755 [Pseudomonadota bacterium]